MIKLHPSDKICPYCNINKLKFLYSKYNTYTKTCGSKTCRAMRGNEIFKKKVKDRHPSYVKRQKTKKELRMEEVKKQFDIDLKEYIKEHGEDISQRVCTQCKRYKVGEFYISLTMEKLKLAKTCGRKICRSKRNAEVNRAYYYNHREKCIKTSTEWNRNNKERVRARKAKERREARREKEERRKIEESKRAMNKVEDTLKLPTGTNQSL